MALRHLLLRFSPTIDRRWVIGAMVLAVLLVIGSFIRWGGPSAPLHLLALGPEGQFHDTVVVPAAWGDTDTRTPDAVVRIPLILGVRNPGRVAVRPERLSLSLPLRYRLTARGGEELDGTTEPGSPLLTYTIHPRMPPIEPGRLPALLPEHDTLWLEVVIPAYYCVDVADSVPEFVPAPPPPVGAISNVRIFYAFDGGDLKDRRTGTLAVRMDSSLLTVTAAEAPPTFDMVNDPVLAQPELGSLQWVGSRHTQCGEPGTAMQLLSSVWETPEGGRFIALDYGGVVRKHLYDLNGDGVIERESWAPGQSGEFTATRRTALPIPAFLLPVTSPSGEYDVARIDSLPPDSILRLDPFRRAMTGPGAVPGGDFGPGSDTLRRAMAAPAGPGVAPGALGPPDDPAPAEPAADTLPAPRIQPAPGPLGQPVDMDTIGSSPGP